ncbi:MAG: PaxA [bacterium]|nr:PaxA [bacterium]
MFDRFVAGRRPSWTRRSLLIGSLVLHGSIALVLVAGSWFHVVELTPPMLAVVFRSAAEAPPPPPPPGRAKSTEHRVKTPRPQPTTATQPPTAPDPTPPDDGKGVPNSDGPPDGKGPLGGDPRSPTAPCVGANCSSISAPAPRPRNVPPHALDAQRIAGAMPHLPSSVIGARRGLGDTTFTARLCVDQSGAISSVTVLSGIPGADADIVSTVRGWRYKPQPIPVCFVTQLVYDVQ